MTALVATVETAGYATVQDGGRVGLAQVGVPASGAFHRQRYLVATALLSGGPDPGRPAIEVLAGELRLLMSAEAVLAVVGPSVVRVDDREAAVGAAVLVPEAGRVSVVPRGPGPTYVVIAGWSPARVLGSVATDTFSRLGGGLLGAGSALIGDPEPGVLVRVGAFHRPLSADAGPLRAAAAGSVRMTGLTSARWTVTSVARSGVRISGGSLATHGSAASMPVVPGAVQATPDGSAIILGPDGGLTGGYPVVAVIASADLDRLSLLAPGDLVGFRETDVDEAAAAWRRRERDLGRAIAHPDQLP